MQVQFIVATNVAKFMKMYYNLIYSYIGLEYKFVQLHANSS